MNIIILSGGCDTIHSGHLDMFWDACKLGTVCVCLNSDEWLTRKKGKPFMTWKERAYIIESLIPVDKVIAMNDDDGTACDGIKKAIEYYNTKFPAENHTFYFGNGGDRKSDNTPEIDLCNQLGVKLLWNVGGGKVQSSSDLLAEWVKFKTSTS